MQKRYCTAFLLLLLAACTAKPKENTSVTIGENTRIVSLNGTITELLCLTGYEKNIVGVDVTSNYPETIHSIPKLGHNRDIKSEGIIAQEPDVVFILEKDINKDIQSHLDAAGVKIIPVKQEYSAESTYELVRYFFGLGNKKEDGEKKIEEIQSELSQVQAFAQKPSVLFIYARGSGNLMVAGEKTSMHSIIELAGARNAATGFEDFKPLTPEALLEMNPDIILMFSSGIQSLEGESGLLGIPGVPETNAGKNKAIISMDGQYLSGFGPRLGKAALELNQKIAAFITK